MPEPSHRVFGIRHHGPGSARSLRRAFDVWQPDCVLVEGPPDADDMIPLAAHPDLRPPVALLVYARDLPTAAAFYPMADYSPELVALRWALQAHATARFMDLPQALRLQTDPGAGADAPDPELAFGPPADAEPDPWQTLIRRDPLAALAHAAGYADSERWWEQQVETRQDDTALFAAIGEAMTALRAELSGPEPEDDQRREAHMRETIRQAQKDGFQRIAVVCGAWHLPALTTLGSATTDRRLLKGLTRVKTLATWVPWTNARLSFSSGYGAGIRSPGWYEHLWTCTDDVAGRWLARVAQLLRAADLDASSAQVIDAARLADALAAMRGVPVPGLDELDEATRAVFCTGSDAPLRLVQRDLTVGDRLGAVPDAAPCTPLQRDLEGQQKRLRLPAAAAPKDYDLDLRKPNDLARSHLLHRLHLLDIPWGVVRETWGKAGSFHELWTLAWQPDFAIAIIEAGTWGNSVAGAAAARGLDRARRSDRLADLTALLQQVLLADLAPAMPALMQRLRDVSALITDVSSLMAAAPPLSRILRYGNVRQTDTVMVRHYLDELLTRICIGIRPACSGLNDDAADTMRHHLDEVQQAVALVADARHLADWHDALRGLIHAPATHGLLQGRALRILLDAGAWDGDDAARRLGLALSRAADPRQAAAWVEGFLTGSGLLLLHDDRLFRAVDCWLSTLRRADFDELLPLLRRTFSALPSGERRQIGQRVKQGDSATRTGPAATSAADAATDPDQARLLLPVLQSILGVAT